MLTEIALTPHVFQPCSLDEKNWALQVRALNTRLEHYGSEFPLVFSNLNGGHRIEEWLAVVAKITATPKPAARRAALDLFDRIKREHLVSRPTHGRIRAVADETQWVDEAVKPAPRFPIDQIVTSWQGAAACKGVFGTAISIKDLDGNPFWQTITISPSVLPNIAAQVSALRPIWLHGKFLAVVLPYGLSNEADWFFALANSAIGRPPAHGLPVIEFHVSFDGSAEELKRLGNTHSAIAGFIRRARQALPRGTEITLCVRAKIDDKRQQFIARRLFAGEPVDVGTGKPDVKIRWGVGLEHVAHPGESQGQTPPTFTLLSRQRADNQFRFECRNTVPPLFGPERFRC
jgi:hypothetical protein